MFPSSVILDIVAAWVLWVWITQLVLHEYNRIVIYEWNVQMKSSRTSSFGFMYLKNPFLPCRSRSRQTSADMYSSDS